MAVTDYLCFTALEAGSTVAYTFTVYYYINYIYRMGWGGYYSFDGETWNLYSVSLSSKTGTYSGTEIVLANVGDKVYFKGSYNNPNNSNLYYSVNNSYSGYTYNSFKTTGKVSVSGDITTYATNYAQCVSYAFKYLFYNSTGLVDASGLKLAETVNSYWYYKMFYGCTSLVTPPELPATTLASYCCSRMFDGCTSLTQAPELPATTLATGCYNNMFYGCTSLTQAPELLPATTVFSDSYSYMFYGCTSLVTPPELPATTLASQCYMEMFHGCTSLVTPPELPATTLAPSCYLKMFNGCIGLKSLPELPATTLTYQCYSNMFNGCTKIKLSTTKTSKYNTPYRIPTSRTGTVGENSLYNMFTNTGGTFADTPSINTTYYYYYKKDPVPNKVTYGNTVLLDLSNDTVVASAVRSGVTFHTADGQSAKGTASTGASSTLSGTPGINKVVYNGKTLIDLTADTITPGDVTSGYTFHACDGNQYTGTA